MGKGQGPKAALKDAQSGTPVAGKNFSSKKKESKSSGKQNVFIAFHEPEQHDPQKYEGSYKDSADDYRAARRRGMDVEQHEDSARDRISDNAGQRHLDGEDHEKSETIKHPGGYRQGVSAYSNYPKSAHGFGHTGSQRQGHLRMSGSAGAHQIGKKG